MEPFVIKDDKVNVAEIMEHIRQQIEKKKRVLYTEEELEELAKTKLSSYIHSSEVKSSFAEELQALKADWNISISLESLYKSHPSLYGRMIYRIRKLLRPVTRFFMNIDVLFPEFHKQTKLNLNFAHLLHNLILELTKLRLDHDELKSRLEGLNQRLEHQTKRERTLEKMVVFKKTTSPSKGTKRGKSSPDKDKR
ncbi:hypothetical protein CEE39_00320 [bacterium (candidate division B38) B3_B38]|nr:MAG: hypothetical protein CEE39_00320 [bacterium (candidate division B38) B3_B38]